MLKNLLQTIRRKKIVLEKPSNLKIAKESFFNLSIKLINGIEFNFTHLKNKKTLIVNTASKCGFTPQFKELEELYNNNKNQLTIIGFPCNDFFFQDPASNEKINEFCSINYGVSFLMSEKITLKSKSCSPVYKWLSDPLLNGWNSQLPTWNFCKYLIDENGELLLFANSLVEPENNNIKKFLDLY
jgi:glutathione peroxidase